MRSGPTSAEAGIVKSRGNVVTEATASNPGKPRRRRTRSRRRARRRVILLTTVAAVSLGVSVFFMEGWISSAVSRLKELGFNFSLGGHAARTRLEHAINDLRAGMLVSDEFDKTLVLIQPANVYAQRLVELGALKSIDLLSSEGSRYVYQVSFERGNTIWLIDLAPSGKIAHMSVQF
jgi:HAMP domain-containing protein